MRCYWSEEKCGDPLIMITSYDAHKIIYSILEEFYKEQGIEWAGSGLFLTNRINKELGDAYITAPFGDKVRENPHGK